MDSDDENDVFKTEDPFNSEPEPELQLEDNSPPKKRALRPRQQTRSTSSMTLRPRSIAVRTRNLRSESTFEAVEEDDFVGRSKSAADSKKVGNEDSDDEGRISRKRKTPASFVIISDDEDNEQGNKKPAAPAPKKRGRPSKKVPATINEEGEQDVEAQDAKPKPKKKGAKAKEPKKKKTPEKRRHRIKGIDELEVDTRKAMKEELERQKRIEERQKVYNLTALAESLPPTETTDNVVILEQNETVTLQIDPEIARKLKKHQIDAVQFIWTACCESLDRLRNPTNSGSGCIVAHCMGLGKTLSVIAFLHAVLFNRELTGVKTCLALAPLNTVLNWVSEFQRWLPSGKLIDVYEISSLKETKERAAEIEAWHQNGGVMLMGYDIYRKLAQTKPRNRWAKAAIFQPALLNPGPDIVVCDEGHLLKSETSVISKVLNQIRTRRRIVMTGTPLQNNLFEYHCMVSFIKPNFLGTKKEFANMFATPIKNGETADADAYDVNMMKKRTSVLFRLLAPCVHRRGYEHLATVLPPKHEYVLLLRLTPVQCKLYARYLSEIVGVSPRSLENITENDAHYIRRRLFTDYHSLQYICAHPCLLFDAHERAIEREIKNEIKRDMEAMSVDDDDEFEMQLDDDEEEEYISTSEDVENVFCVSGTNSRASGDGAAGTAENFVEPVNPISRASGAESRVESGVGPSRASHYRPTTRASSRRAVDSAVAFDEMAACEMEVEEQEKPWFASEISQDRTTKAEISSKFLVMLHLLRSFEAIGDKTIIFSQSLIFLDLFELALAEEAKRRQEAIANNGDQTLAELIPSFERNKDYFRIDGQVTASVRRDAINLFNNTEDNHARLFLISTKAGGIGVNLVGANRVILTDASWNPSQDVQAIFRAYRYGQKKPVCIYRLIAHGTMEEKIYDRQVVKQSLSQRVIDEQQIARHFTIADLLALYRFDEHESAIPELPNLDSSMMSSSSEPPCDLATLAARFIPPKDLVLAEMLHKVPHWFASYHTHDSLLVHQVHEQLDESERLAAWREYELAQRKQITVDSADAVATHRQLTWALRRELGLEQHEADLRAICELRDLFGSIRPNVREFVEQYLPYYERVVAETEERKRQLLQNPSSSSEGSSSNEPQSNYNSNAVDPFKQPEVPLTHFGFALQNRRRSTFNRRRRHWPMNMGKLVEDITKRFGVQAAEAALASNNGQFEGENTSSSSEQASSMSQYRDTCSNANDDDDFDATSETMSYQGTTSDTEDELPELL